MHNNDIQYPFIGLRTYEEADAIFFRGRKSSTTDLFRMISDNDIVVLHAESGEGKSSLLNAGLFPMLRDERFFPIKISFTEEDYALDNPDFDKIVYHRIVDSVNQINGDSPNDQVFRATPSINGKVSILPIAGKEDLLSKSNQLRQCAWWLLRNYSLNAYGASLIPVLVFDQFEEVFTRPNSNTWTEDFFLWLSSTLNDTVPQNVIDSVREIIGEDTEFPKIRTNKKFKVLFSLRTEYIGELDYWGIQRHHISVLKNSRYCLKPLTELEADEVLELQPIFTSQIRNQIKGAIRSTHGSRRTQSNLPTIPAMLLSVVSTTVTNNMAKNGQAFDNVTRISDKDLGSDLFTNIIDQFYQKEIVEANIPKKVIQHIETVLVDDKGKRVRIKADSKELRKFDFEHKYKPVLEQKRLIKCTQINGDEYVELTHDALAKVITKRRDINLIDRSRWTNYVLIGSFCLIVLLAIVYWFSLLAKDYIYSGYDAMREYHYIKTNLFKKILISCGFIPIVYWGVKQYHKSTELAPKIRYIILSYAFVSMYYWGILYIINYIVYPNHTWMHNGVLSERILAQMAFFIIGSIMILIGCLLIQWEKYIKNVRWPILLGIPLIICSLLPIIYTLRPIISFILVTFAVFHCISYVLKKERNTLWFCLTGMVLIIISHILYSPYGNLPKICIVTMVAIIIGYILYSFTFKKEYNIYFTFKNIVYSKNYRQNKLVRTLYGIYYTAICLFLSIALGYRLNNLYSLIGLLITCPTVIHIVSCYITPIKDNTQKYFLFTICTLGIITIWAVQYTYYHFWAVIIIWMLGISSIILVSYRLSKPEHNTKVYSSLKMCINQIIIFIFVVGIMPFLLMGYNIIAYNYYSIIFNRTEYIKAVDTKLIYVRNSDGKIGLVDRRGDIIIPIKYTQIIPNYYTKYDNYWDNNYKAKTLFSGFIIIQDWQIEQWELDNHINNNRLITYKDSLKNYEDSDNKQFVDTSIEENRFKNLIVESIKAKNKDISEQNDWRFNHKDTAHLKLLNNIDFRFIPIHLSATSVAFQKCYLDTILPKLKFGSYGLVSEVLSPFYNWDDNIKKNAADIDIESVLSDNITEIMLVRRELGGMLSRLASTFAVCGRFQDAEYFSWLSLTKGKYDEKGKVLYLKALISQNKIAEAVEFISKKENELYNETSDIFPEEEYSWIDIRYTPLINHLPIKDREILKKQGYTFTVKDLLPFDEIQLLPDSINGDMYRYFKTYPLPNGNSRTYSYFVKEGKRVTPPLSFWSIFNNHGDPILAIDCITKKRRFIKTNDIIGNAYTYEEIYEDGSLSHPHWAYSQKYIKGLLEGHPNKYIITETYRHSENYPSTFISPKLIKGEYNHAWPFSEGLAAVEIEGKIGFINLEGDIVIEPKYYSPFNHRIGFLGEFYHIYSTGQFYNPYFRNGVCPVYDEQSNLIWIDKLGVCTKEPSVLPSKVIY